MFALSKLEIVESMERALLLANINFFTEFTEGKKGFDHNCKIILTDALTDGYTRLVILMVPKTPFIVEPYLIIENPIKQTSESIPLNGIDQIIGHLKKLKSFA